MACSLALTACDLALKDLLGPLATALSAVGAVWAVTRTLKANRTARAEERAFDAFDEYLKLCLQNTEFANGQLVQQKFALPDKYQEGDPEFYKYEWHVCYLLTAAEQILEVTHGDREWIATIRTHVAKHRQYLEKDYFNPKVYAPNLRSIIHYVINQERCCGAHREGRE